MKICKLLILLFVCLFSCKKENKQECLKSAINSGYVETIIDCMDNIDYISQRANYYMFRNKENRLLMISKDRNSSRIYYLNKNIQIEADSFGCSIEKINMLIDFYQEYSINEIRNKNNSVWFSIKNEQNIDFIYLKDSTIEIEQKNYEWISGNWYKRFNTIE